LAPSDIDLLIQDFSNLHVREHLEFYPHDGEGHLSEVWHGEKMACGHNCKQLTPMVINNGKSFFVGEVSRLRSGTYFIPDMFIKRHGELYARGHQLISQPEVRCDMFHTFDC
jgi:hypothetical protein